MDIESVNHREMEIDGRWVAKGQMQNPEMGQLQKGGSGQMQQTCNGTVT